MDLKQKMFTYSPWIYHLHAGGCNGCDIELVAALTPRFDVERFGVRLVASPRHADILVVTGPVTRHISSFLKRVYLQVPDPKVVVAIGVCACSGGIFNEVEGEETYSIIGGIDRIIPVDVYISGCPPKPENIINGVFKAIEVLRKKCVEV
ncbi:MAG: NADH-quinone oxidoreductase subunit B family protein [Candidatus Methanomethylicia archaeon]|nr:NADH-quinone oxidoreductase subunit B family protein [Candidatus Methanomethylicia archaeon]